MPRRYQMATRERAVQETRQRIIDAAISLHAQRGVIATNWEEIAEGAGVSTATVYRHFPSLGELVPACARTAFEAGASLPTPAQAAAAFAGLTRPAPRIERLIRESCRCYELGAGWLAAARRDAKSVPALDRAVRLQDRVLGVLIQTALGDAFVDAQTMSVIKALIDFPFWKALTDAGVATETVPQVINDLVRSRLQKRR
ncbi:MAG: TetR family transcriptional regulator [Chloroflexi bacterium]|nr:MAG: TetR family transcriptional regulator [Chloroflexota bacterium]